MVGLIYKNIYIVKDKILSMLLVGIGVIFIFELLLLSVRYGNLKPFFPEAVIMRDDFVRAAYVIAGTLFLLPVVMFETFFMDKVSGFKEVQYAMPILPKTKVGADYISFFGFLGIICLIDMAVMEMFLATIGSSMQSSDVKIVYFIFAVAVLIYCMLLPAMYISLKGMAVVGGVLYMIFCGNFLLDEGKTIGKIAGKLLSMNSAGVLFSFVVLAGCVMLSAKLAVAFEERRNRRCRVILKKMPS